MARDHARVKFSIWQDDDFKALSPLGQRLYLVLMTNPRLTYCGVLDYIPKRLASLSSGTSVDGIEASLSELEDGRFVVVDRDTDEVLVRTFVRHDGLLSQPNVVVAMVRDFDGITSSGLRAAFLVELHRAHTEDPEAKGWPKAESLLQLPYPNPSGNPSPDPSGKGCRTPAPAPTPAPSPTPVSCSVVAEEVDRPHLANAGDETTTINLEAITSAVGCTDAEAKHIADQLLAGRHDVGNATQYVLRCIRNDPNRFQARPQPERAKPCQHGRKFACAQCREMQESA